MATIASLIPLIYHEPQEEGSMLCAQHALNSLLQGQYFSAPDLSQIAHRLDDFERSHLDDNQGGSSTNMDDTGFFSVQVLEEALKVWNLSLVRWRSEVMRPYQDHPHTQLGFILNQHQHWYSLRRFGRVSIDPSPEADPGEGHWFNLNSALPAPERIGKLYLGMFLQQAETEGYSIFAVVQKDPAGPLALPRTEADELAASIPESAAHQSYTPQAAAGLEGFEDEDMELQAALQASLSGADRFDPVHFAQFAYNPPAATASTSGHAVPRPLGNQPRYINVDDDDDIDTGSAQLPPLAAPEDPVAASMARNRLLLEQMRRAQEAAMREGFEEDPARAEADAARRRRQQQEQEEEEEMLRRAIAESEAMARAEGHAPLDDNDDDVEIVEAPDRQPPRAPAVQGHRVYDDEDEDLQAALRASLESVPPGFRAPSPLPLPVPQPGRQPQAPSQVAAPPLDRQKSTSSTTETDIETETESSIAEEAEPEPVSMEEIRRRRLARFGG